MTQSRSEQSVQGNKDTIVVVADNIVKKEVHNAIAEWQLSNSVKH